MSALSGAQSVWASGRPGRTRAAWRPRRRLSGAGDFLGATGTLHIEEEAVTRALKLRGHHAALVDAGFAELGTPVNYLTGIEVSRNLRPASPSHAASARKGALTMPRKFGVLLMGSALLAAAATACSASAAALPGAAAGTEPVEVLSVSFISPRMGWLLGEHGQQAPRVIMRKTVNGGKSWTAVPAPAAPAADMFQSGPPPDAVGSILFTGKTDGWAFGPALWRTADGGTTWRRERVPGPVVDLKVTGNRMLAVITRVGDPDLRLYAAPVGSGDWRPVPGGAVSGFFTESLAVSGRTGYLLVSRVELDRPVLLAGPAAGEAPWRRLPEPCPGGWSAALAAAPGWLFVGCGNEPGAGNELKTAYLSLNGGHTWHRVASPPVGGYLGGATMSAGGTIFLFGERMDVYISGDRGRAWFESPSLRNAAGLANAGFFLVATALTDKVGVTFEKGVTAQQVWLTRDGGRRWSPVTVR